MALGALDTAVLIGAGIAASFVAGVTGGGVTVILLPVLVLHFGIYLAVPIVTIALVAASASRVGAYRREIALPVAAWFSVGSLPLALAGTYLFTVSPQDVLTRLLGAFLLAAVALQRLRTRPPAPFAAAWFLPIGAVFGFLTGISISVAVIVAPFYLGYGLRKGAFVGTMGLNVLLIQLAKLAVFGNRQFLGGPVLLYGALLVPFMVLGTLLGRQLLRLLPERAFVLLIEAVMLLAGLNFLLRGAARARRPTPPQGAAAGWRRSPWPGRRSCRPSPRCGPRRRRSCASCAPACPPRAGPPRRPARCAAS
jgi:uncharacterized protein